MSRARPKNPSQQDLESINDNLNEIIDEFKTIIPNQKDFEVRKPEYKYYNNKLKLVVTQNELCLVLREMLRDKIYPGPALVRLLIRKLSEKYINHAYDLYIDAASKGVAGQLTHNIMINEAGKHGRMDLATNAYGNATDSKNYADNGYAHISMINEAGKHGRMDLAIYAYDKATNSNNYPVNIQVHISMINKAGKNGRMDLVIKAYDKATDSKNYPPNVDAHISMINAANKNGRMDLVIKAYDKATDPKNNVANADIHIRMIHAATLNDRIDLVIKAYNNATHPSHYQANYLTHMAMLDALVLYCRFDEAVEVYRKSGLRLAIEHTNGLDKIDLHEFSYGSVYTGLNEHIKNSTKPLKMTIIYGKGLHVKDKNKNDVHDVKRSTYQLFEDLRHEYEITAKEDPNNSGKAFCQVLRKPTLFSTGNSATSKMNPKAASFTPTKKA